MGKADKTRYLIIGNSAGGIGAAEAIRDVDKAETITIVSDEPYSAYSRPLISEHLAEGYPIDKMLFRPPDFYQEHNIMTIFGQKVTKLDIDKHKVTLDDSRKIIFDKLLLATGGSPIIPKMEGTTLKGVFTFSTLDDAKAINNFLNRYHHGVSAVVIGGGLIGVSVTEALVKRGVEVTIIEMKDRILNTILDEEASIMEEKNIDKFGVRIITGHTVEKISSYLPDQATSITLDDGHKIPCEMVVVAIGVQPRTELVSSTDIKKNRGIIVDHHMNTSNPDVYACGDVAEAYDFIYGENRLTPIWPNAYIGGRIAGLNMAGVPMEYQGGTAMNAMKYFGMNIVSAGMAISSDSGYEEITFKNNSHYRKIVLKDGLIAGLIFSGNIEKSGIIYSLMKDRVNVEDFKQVLVAEDFGLAYLPEEIWRPKLSIPPSLLASAVTFVEQPTEVIAGE